MNLPERIEKKISRIPFSGCWIWIGAANRYGSSYFNGKHYRAHRLVYELLVSRIPSGMELMHTCDECLCVNPDHLVPGTHQENMRDMARKGRSKAPSGQLHWTKVNPEKAIAVARKNIKATHRSGERNNNAKVNFGIAQQIRVLRKERPEIRDADLGKQFGIGREQTRKILRGLIWNT